LENQARFLGTYFNKDSVLRLALVARILSWIVAGIYLVQWLIQAIMMIPQIISGYWAGMRITEIYQSLFYLFEQPLRGLVYFVVLQAAVFALLIFMDIEDNTRRMARKFEPK
jgi:hypothetical protein